MARIARRLEALLLFAGAALLGVWTGTAAHQRAFAAWDRAVFARDQPQAAPLASASPERAWLEPAWLEPLIDTTLWSAGRIAGYLDTLGTAPAGGGVERLGLLEIPAIDLAVVVLDGTDDWTLNRGVGRIEGTAAPGAAGNAGIAGHRDGFFRGLAHVAEGDRLLLTTPGSAEPREYRIEWLRVVRPEDVWVLEPTDASSLTLVTCHPFYFVGNAPDRYVVRAVAVDAEAPGAAERAERSPGLDRAARG